MSDLAAFLLSRITEDEAIAGAANEPERQPHPWSTFAITRFDEGDWQALDPAATSHAYQWDPARVLAECEAKRRIVRYVQAVLVTTWDDGNPEEIVTDVLRLLALPFSGHPDYDESWRP